MLFPNTCKEFIIYCHGLLFFNHRLQKKKSRGNPFLGLALYLLTVYTSKEYTFCTDMIP